MNCFICGVPHADEQREVHPVSKDVEIVFTFPCGKKIKIVRQGMNHVPIELARCQMEEPPKNYGRAEWNKPKKK